MPEARAQIIIEGIDRFSRVAKSIERGLGGLERSALALSGVGKRLTLGVTMPMAGMGVMAVKTAAKFDTALKAIQAVGGHTEEQIEELGDKYRRSRWKCRCSRGKHRGSWSSHSNYDEGRLQRS